MERASPETSEGRAWHRAFEAKDPRFDGRFFVGVSTTGVYCRPICRAKTPKPGNRAFFRTAAEAERAGYRPCLLCRPELAPGSSRMDATAGLAQRAARLLQENCGLDMGIEEAAERLGSSSRHLRRAFCAEFGVTPLEYLQTCRLLLAKALLTDTELPVIEVALASGFRSLRRFNETFKRRYRLAPLALRKRTGAGLPGARSAGSEIRIALPYRPPYRWEEMLDFLAARALPGVESVSGGEYLRTIRLEAGPGLMVQGWLRVGIGPGEGLLSLRMDAALLPALSRAAAKVRQLFDTGCDPEAVYRALASMNDIRPGLCRPGTRLPGSVDPFETIVRAVLGQRISVKAATTLAARLARAFGAPLDTGIEGLDTLFPSPREILALDSPVADRLGPLGITAAQSRAILESARALASGSLCLEPGAEPEAEVSALREIPGVGEWTARYAAMRAMGWTDAFLGGDLGVRKALAPLGVREAEELAAAWSPWRSYATVNLWNSLRQEHEEESDGLLRAL